MVDIASLIYINECSYIIEIIYMYHFHFLFFFWFFFVYINITYTGKIIWILENISIQQHLGVITIKEISFILKSSI